MMKKQYYLLILALLFTLGTWAQGNITISTVRLGPIKVLASIDSVYKFVDKKIALYKLNNEKNYGMDTVYNSYKSIPIRLVFNRYYNEETQSTVSELYSIYTESNLITSKSGIQLGANKYDILKLFENKSLSVEPRTDIGKGISSIRFYDEDNANYFSFYFKNNVLYAFETGYAGEGC